MYVITDLAENDWGPHRLDPQLVEQWQRLRDLAAVHLVDVNASADRPPSNVAIVALTNADPFVTAGRGARYDVELRSFAAADVDVDVQLASAGQTVARRSLTITPGQTQNVRLDAILNEPGLQVVEARIGDDALTPDDRAWRVVPVEETVDVLCVDGNPAGSPLAGACGYLSIALAPEGAAGDSQTRVSAKIVGEGSWLDEDLEDYAVVALCNVGQFTAAEVRALDAYLRNGGAAWFFLGDRVQLDNYNRVLAADDATGNADTPDAPAATGGSSSAPLLPAGLLELASPGAYMIDPLDYAHPIVEPFREHRRAGLLTTPVARYVRLAPRDDARTVLALENGDPLIVESDALGGTCVLVATSADDSWTAMPMLPSYVPLVQEMLAYSVERRANLHNLVVGDPLRLPTGRATQPVTVQLPDGEEVAHDVDANHTTSTNTERSNEEADAAPSSPAEFRNTMRGGVYRVAAGDTTVPFAVNVDTRESDLGRTSLATLKDALDAAGGFDYVGQTATVGNDETLPGRHAGFERLLIFGALAFLFSESLIAWHLGRQGGGP
ncbi:MAG: hypothetical protein R3C10_22890 [Pirellulales bacterium]